MEEIEETTKQLEELQGYVSQYLKNIGAYQPLSNTEENKSVAQELYLYGYYFYENGHYLKAIDFFKILTHIEAENVQYWVGLAASLQMQKLYDNALLAYSTAIILDPNDQAVYFHAANCCFALGQISEGLKALEIAEQVAAEKPEQGAFIAQITALKEVWANELKKT